MTRILPALTLACTLVLATPAYSQANPVAASAAPASSPATEGARPALPNTLMDGTAVSLRLAETVSSADAHVGQTVPIEVTDDVVVQGVTVIAKGAPAIATVTTAEPKKRMGRGGKLDVNSDSVRLADGSKVQLSATKNTSGGGHVGAMTGAMVGTAVVFFPAAPLFLLMHGKDITISKGTAITAFVQGDTKLDMARHTGKPDPNTPAGAPAQALAGIQPGTLATAQPAGGATQSGTSATAGQLMPAAATANMATVQIDSNVPGADIEIDNAFAGNTPSTLTVPAGQHTITVKKKNYPDWTRTLNVSGTNVHLNADLIK